jgi:hypothetical protein
VTGDEATVALINALNAAAIPYMVVGSFSSNYYGIPRSTQDADFVLDAGSESLAELFRQLGPKFKFDPQLSFETATGTKRNVVGIRGTKFKIELFRLSSDPHDQERFRRRLSVKLPDCDTFVPTAEDVIITKLRWAQQAKRNKDVDDVHDVIAVQANRIDWDYVYKWCDQHVTRGLLDQIRDSIPPI